MIEMDNDFYISKIKVDTHIALIIAIIDQALSDLKISLTSVRLKESGDTDRNSAIDFLMNDSDLLRHYLELLPGINVSKMMNGLKIKSEQILAHKKKKQLDKLNRNQKNEEN